MSRNEQNSGIALALSGGGIRAMVFHLGVLRCLAENGLLESVTRVSTVSGGSLLIGLALKECEMSWPSSPAFVSTVYPHLREKLCRRSLQWGAARQLLNPLRLRFLVSRANLLSLALTEEWGIDCKLSDLPQHPEWSINGTTAENGKRFRFKRHNFGDYELGYASSLEFPLADALAVSAAFPGGFGPLRIDALRYDWRKREWDAPAGSEQGVDVGYRYLHLYDGGLYDNLGLEPFFDAGKGVSKCQDDFILVSDAGSPLPSGFSFRSFNPRRMMRLADIISNQAHALRIRTFVNFVQQGPHRGALVFIKTATGTSPSSDTSRFVWEFPTTLRRLTFDQFDHIAKHGYEVARKIYREYGFGMARQVRRC